MYVLLKLHKRRVLGIAVFLSVVAQLFVAVTAANAAESQGPSGGQSRDVPPFDPSKAKLIEQDETYDLYLNPDGTHTLRTYSGAVNWRDDAGRWNRIDRRVVGGPPGQGFRNASGPLRISFPERASAGRLATMAGDGWSVSFGLDGIRSGSPGKATGSKLRYAEVDTGVDLEYEVLPKVWVTPNLVTASDLRRYTSKPSRAYQDEVGTNWSNRSFTCCSGSSSGCSSAAGAIWQKQNSKSSSCATS